MKPMDWRRTTLGLILLIPLWLAGCGGDSGSDLDYSGTWRGSTSHGGTVEFTVDGPEVTALRIVDDQARLEIKPPVSIERDSFSADNSRIVPTTGNPLVSLQCAFDSETHASGRYAVSTWSGTFEASRQ